MCKRLLFGLWILWLSAVFCQSLLTSIIALGWIYRWVCVDSHRHLFKCSPLADTTTWQDFSSQHPDLQALQTVPRYFQVQPGISSEGNRIQRFFHKRFHSFWLNGRQGWSGILTTWSLTLLPCLIWSWAWYTGWQISFTKLYEESATGFSMGLLGFLLFTAVMFYLPVAQARHAFTRDWGSFFQVRFLCALINQFPLRYALLALGYVGSSFVLLYFKALPAFFPSMNPLLADLSIPESLELLNRYYFYTGSLAFILVVILRTWAGRLYTSGLPILWTQSRWPVDTFHEQEVQLLERLQIGYGSASRSQGLVKRLLQGPFSLTYRVGLFLATLLLWSLFSFTPFISEFAHYYPVAGFLNQPLVHLPSFRYVPEHLQAETT
ncbi:MAG: hypothetical protein HC921_08475 [Synechococcaceae cyanobacterium SM2_3_1]|nr:hypothetical protein [Synechococcaceae cyanobacterium SM2_3_1]